MSHTCYAWCEGDRHVCVISTMVNPPNLEVGLTWPKGGRYAQIISFEPAGPEFTDSTAPAGYDYHWLVWFRFVDKPGPIALVPQSLIQP